MGKRLNRFHSEDIRRKIQASQLVNRLHSCAMGEIELTLTQLRAIEILLDRSVAKLAHIDVTVADGTGLPSGLMVVYAGTTENRVPPQTLLPLQS